MTRMSLSKWVAFGFLLLWLSVVPAPAQTETGQITGTITDPSSAVVPNATVTVKLAGTQTTRSTTTNERGSSTFSEAPNNLNLGLLDPFDKRLDQGDADFDIRNRGVVSGIWDIPFNRLPFTRNPQQKWFRRIIDGWTIASVVTARSGAPYSLFDCSNAFVFARGQRSTARFRVGAPSKFQRRPDKGTGSCFWT